MGAEQPPIRGAGRGPRRSPESLRNPRRGGEIRDGVEGGDSDLGQCPVPADGFAGASPFQYEQRRDPGSLRRPGKGRPSEPSFAKSRGKGEDRWIANRPSRTARFCKQEPLRQSTFPPVESPKGGLLAPKWQHSGFK